MFPTSVKIFISKNEIEELLEDKGAVFNHLSLIFHSIIQTHTFCLLVQLRKDYI
jgi:hypothetical protein